MPKKVYYSSSTPIKPIFDPVSKYTKAATDWTMRYEKIYPGIYLTSVKDLCPADDLKIYGFTHIIYIDKHVIQNDANDRSCVNNKSIQSFNIDNMNTSTNYAETAVTASITIKPKTYANQNQTSALLPEEVTNAGSSTSMAFNTQEMLIYDNLTTKKMFSSLAHNELQFVHNDFETLDLNFGESSYLTTVLPNCYKAVKFIEKALKNNGAVLVIDCIGESQKCITIVIGFLMYKYNKNFL